MIEKPRRSRRRIRDTAVEDEATVRRAATAASVGNVAEWYLTNFRVRVAREDGSWFDPDVEDFGGEPCPGC